MGKATYGVGDIVVLREGPLRTSRVQGRFKILAVLPVSDGMVQYRVRSESEGFDRRVSSGDIDVQVSPTPHIVLPPGPKEPWFKPSSIKAGK